MINVIINSIKKRPMKKLVLLCFLSTIVLTTKAQNLKQYAAEGKIGFKDAAGNIVIPAKYESVSKTRDKYYLVESNEKFGIIDNQGKERIKLKYKSIYEESAGIFRVENDEDKMGIFDINGTEIIPFSHQYFVQFTEDVWVTMSRTMPQKGKFGAIDRKGKEIIAPKYDFLRGCSEGVFSGQINDKWGFIKMTGEELTPFIYTYECQNFSEGLAVVALGEKKGYIDKSGKVVIPIIYDKARSFYKGVAIVKLDGKYFMIDKNAKVIKNLKYDGTHRWQEKDVLTVYLNEKRGRINIATGEEVIPLIYDDIDPFEKDLSAWVQLNEKWGVIDKLGKVIVPIQYDSKQILYSGNNLYKVKMNNKFGLLDADRKELTKVKYDSIGDFREGFALVKMDNKFGFIDLLGQELGPITYNKALGFSEGLATVINAGHWSYINKKGEEFPVYYGGFMNYQYVDSFSGGLCLVYKDKKYGFVNKNGTLILQLIYDSATNFRDGLSAVEINKKWGFIDSAGNEIIPIKYENVSYFENGIADVVLSGRKFVIDKKGNEVEKNKE